MKEQINVNLRLPADLHAALKEIAEKEARSLNSQILVFLRRAVEEYQPKVKDR